MKKKENVALYIVTMLIGGLLIVGTVINIDLLWNPLNRLTNEQIDFSQFVSEVKGAYVADFTGKEHFINVNGLFARMTGRHVYNEVAALKNGMLDYETIKRTDTSSLADAIDRFQDKLNKNHISFLYVQVPCKADMKNTLVRDGIENHGNENADRLLEDLKQNRVEVLDLRSHVAEDKEKIEKYFYKTDHHWNTQGAMVATDVLLQYLSNTFPKLSIDPKLADPTNWEKHVYKKWFLGSHGKRVGVCYGGIDDIEIYMPRFKTDMSLSIPKHGKQFHGDFESVLIRKDLLDTPDYFNENPYYAYVGGDYPLVHHENHITKNQLKVLLIKDSFSLPLQSFLSTAVKELDVLDPRYYRDTTVYEYVMKSRPDIVILAINPSVFDSVEYQHLS